MRVTLIGADNERWASGMRSISSTLREAGHPTTMIFAGRPEAPVDEPMIRGIASLVGDSGIIGISSMSVGSRRAKALIAGLRPLGKPIVWGGMYPTLYPQDCVAHADLVCRGEGEGFMLELVERLEAGRGFADILNGAYLSDGRLVLNDLRPLIPDLDALPFPSFDFEDEYCVTASGSLVPNGAMRDEGSVLFSGSRGCDNSCTYCSNSQLKAIYRGHGTYVRKMSISAFIAAAREYRRLFPAARDLYFTDEDFFARSVEDMRALAEAYPSEVGVPFEVMASPRQITDEKVALAAKAGMWRVDVGLESGSERTRTEVFNRYVDDETQLEAARVINRHERIVAYYFLILGNPYEEREDLIDGVRLLRKMPRPFFLRAYNLVFLPGTALFRRACADGVIAGIDDSASDLDFLAGFDYKGHEWKRKNLYLNALMALMVGKSTRSHMGYVPRMLVPVLTSERVVAFCDRHPRIGEAIVGQADLGAKAHHMALTLVGKVLPDRRIAYGLMSYFRRSRESSPR
jgi:radical SAM superfamily enzyme YgiQ (UPF0313 family)